MDSLPTRKRDDALGLTPADIEEFRMILREEYGEELSVPDAWNRAIEVLSLFAFFLERLSRKQTRGREFEHPPA